MGTLSFAGLVATTSGFHPFGVESNKNL